jgi:hypothetical protein
MTPGDVAVPRLYAMSYVMATKWVRHTKKWVTSRDKMGYVIRKNGLRHTKNPPLREDKSMTNR